jgi:outer membrane protein assembly factor BamB
MRNLVLLTVVCALLGACGLFGSGRSKVSEEELKERISINQLGEKLAPDARFAATTIVLPAPQPARNWTQVAINAAKQTGHLDAAPDLRIEWRSSVGAGTDTRRSLVAAPVVQDGKVYVIDADQRVSAWEAATGQRIWTRQLSPVGKRDNHAVGGGLAVAGDRLIVPSGFGYVAALSISDGSELWLRRTESPMSGSPAILGARAYVTSTNNEIYALDTATGEIVWTDQAIAESARVLSSPSPAVTNDILVAPYSSGELIAYLPANGRRLWTDTLTSSGVYTPMSAINDIAGRPSVQDGVVYAASHSGLLTATDARSGTRMWAQQIGSRIGPVVGGDYIFIVDSNGQVACLSRVDGGVVWVRSLPEFRKSNKRERIVWTGPLLASNRLVLVSSAGELLALSPQTGETLAELRIGKPVYVEPIAADGRIFVLTDDAQLISIR